MTEVIRDVNMREKKETDGPTGQGITLMQGRDSGSARGLGANKITCSHTYQRHTKSITKSIPRTKNIGHTKITTKSKQKMKANLVLYAKGVSIVSHRTTIN